ncbi:MAG: 4'-phosphopantetheinyl transferase family protein [Acidobacteriota bacterium]
MKQPHRKRSENPKWRHNSPAAPSSRLLTGETAKDSFQLESGQIHLWRLDLDLAPQYLRLAGDLLSSDEKERARRYRFEKIRSRFVGSRSLLRVVLAGYLGVTPRRITFEYGVNGKPALSNQESPPGLQFNLSHSSSVGLLAVTLQDPIGVDIERIRPLHDVDRLARSCFAEHEFSLFKEVGPDEKLDVFYRCWTRKEAFVKALGQGLTRSTRSFEVSFLDPAKASLVAMEGHPLEPELWSIEPLEPAEGYVGALAVRRPSARISWLC